MHVTIRRRDAKSNQILDIVSSEKALVDSVKGLLAGGNTLILTQYDWDDSAEFADQEEE